MAEDQLHQQTGKISAVTITALEKLMIILNVVYLTYPLGTVLFITFIGLPSATSSDNPLAGIEHIPLYVFLIALYGIVATFAGLIALILDIVYLRKFHPAGKRKQLAIISIASICICAVAINIIEPMLRA